MQARLIRFHGKILLLCKDGSIAVATEDILRRVFVGYSGAKEFHGKYGCWDEICSNMEDYHGTTLAWITDDGLLVIKENPFISLVEAVVEEDYITVQEYANMHGRSDTLIKRLCREGRISGAVRKGNRWFIPRHAPYPDDARYSGVEK